MIPDCPQCERRLTALSISSTRRGRRPRPEPWWQCSQCGWPGYQSSDGECLMRMRLLEGTDADCDFCRDPQVMVHSEVWEQDDGEPRDWVVCLACGWNGARQLGYARRNGGRPG